MHPLIVCPVCHAVLHLGNAATVCSTCGEHYERHQGIPVLVAKRFVDSFKETEQHFHDDLSESASIGGVKGRNSSFHRHFEKPMLDLPAEAAVLEVACGTRVDGIEIALSGKEVTSFDLSPEAVHHASQLAQRAGVAGKIRFIAADAEHLPFSDRSFDAAFVAASFHHFPDQIRALREMKRVTKPGGYVIWGVEPASWPYKTLYMLLAPIKRFIRTHRHRTHNSIADDTTEGYTEESIRTLFRDAGLRIVDIRRVKLLSEFYDSSVRLYGRLTHRQTRSIRTVDHVLSRVDDVLSMIPGLNRLFWHFNVIAVVPS